VAFNVPTNFYDMREAQKMELKINTFNNIASNENISVTWAMKKYLKLEDKDILSNREFLRSDAMLTFEIQQIQTNGPNWREMLLQQAEGGMEGGDIGGDLGGGGGGGSGIPPAFGGGEVSVGDDVETDVPESEPAPPEEPI
jgi:hypothetical protein